MANNRYKEIVGVAHFNTDGLDDIDLDEINRLIANIENVSFYFGVGLVELTEGQNIEAGKLVEDLDGLLAYENNFIIEIYGETDGSGTVNINKVIAFQRALSMKRLLIENGVSERLTRIIDEGFPQPGNIDNNSRRVYLKIVLPGASN
jgi:outer membrane protein OmpA-like peptidoglycan-associated protein